MAKEKAAASLVVSGSGAALGTKGKRMHVVQAERFGALLVVRLNRPERRNAIGDGMLAVLLDAFRHAEDDESVRAIITTGNGLDFCVGADVGALDAAVSAEGQAADRGGKNNGLRPLRGIAERLDEWGPGRWAAAVKELTTPRIAAIEGAAAGGGLCLAALHHFRVAAETAKFAAGFVALGLAPELGLSQLLPQLVGPQAARRILVANDRLAAPEALALGLVDKVVPHGTALEKARELGERIAELPPLAVRSTLSLLEKSPHCSYDQQLRNEYGAQRRLFDTDDHREAVSAFSQRRAATFHGR